MLIFCFWVVSLFLWFNYFLVPLFTLCSVFLVGILFWVYPLYSVFSFSPQGSDSCWSLTLVVLISPVWSLARQSSVRCQSVTAAVTYSLVPHSIYAPLFVSVLVRSLPLLTSIGLCRRSFLLSSGYPIVKVFHHFVCCFPSLVYGFLAPPPLWFL